jgi:hypothetical protein
MNPIIIHLFDAEVLFHIKTEAIRIQERAEMQLYPHYSDETKAGIYFAIGAFMFFVHI